MSEQKSTFSALNSVNVNDKTEKKDNLTYLSWAWAWAEVKKQFPDASYEVIKFGGIPYVFDPKTGYMVYTTVTIDNLTHEMWLPVMNGANKAMLDREYTYSVAAWKNGVKTMVSKSVEAATMIDINKTIMRCLTKNLAMHGLGLYIYAGEDIPETPVDDEPKEKAPAVDKVERPAPMLKEKGVKKVPMPPPATPPAEKPFEEEKQTPPPAPTTLPAEQAPAPEKQKPVAAAESKKPVVIRELVIGSADWARVLAYIGVNKQLGYEAIVNALSSKYTMGPGVKKQLKAEIERA